MKILLIGAKGRMGQKMQELLEKSAHDYLGVDIENRKIAQDYDADVIVDFSSHACLEENLKMAQEKNIPIVIATTNHDTKNLELICQHKAKLPIFMASNFSIMFCVLLKIISHLNILNGCDFVVEETHHKNKKDSPSGSCKEILKKLQEIDVTPAVSAYRVGQVIGNHSIKIYSNNETLQITHDVTDRKVFCEGALKACEFITTKPNGLYGMNDLIESFK